MKYKKPEGTHIRGICVACGLNKQKKSTNKNKSGKQLYRPICSSCDNRLYKSKERARKEKQSKRETRYGVSQELYLEILESQGRKFGICSRSFNEELSNNIDHCHETGKVRGILCFRCNTTLGKLGDNYESVLKMSKLMLDYLK